MTFVDRFSFSFDVQDGILYDKNATRPGEFEKSYIGLREKEGRVYTDTQVQSLPDVPAGHPKKSEWDLRKISLLKLIAHLKKSGNTKSLLEIGCGNGWLAHAMASGLPAQVCALDINEIELRQGARVFQCPDLIFIYADIFTVDFHGHQFDTIILASSIQYFSDLPGLLRRLLEMVAPGGRIYLLDSPWYTTKTVAAARERSKTYFESLGFPEMNESYFHHTLSELLPFNHRIIFDPNSIASLIKKKVLRRQLPYFPWIEINAA